MGFGIPSPEEMFEDMVGAAADALLAVATPVIEMFNDLVFYLPAPGQIDDPSTWTDPQNDAWPGIIEAMGYTMALAIPLWGLALVRAFGTADTRERRETFRACMYAGGMILVGLPVAACILHITNGVITGLAPDAEAFFETPEGLAQLGIGAFFGLLLAIVQTGTVVVGLVVLALERFLIYATVFLWPLAWAARAHNGFARSLGQTITYLFGVTVGLKLVQALLVRGIFEVGLMTDTAGEALAALIMTTAGLLFVFVILPKNMLSHANDAASVSLGMSAAQQRSKEYADASAERVRERVTNSYQSYHEPDTDTGGGAVSTGHRGSVGAVSSGYNGRRGATLDSNAYDATGTSTNSPDLDDAPGTGTRGLDYDAWDERIDRMDYDRDRGFQ